VVVVDVWVPVYPVVVVDAWVPVYPVVVVVLQVVVSVMVVVLQVVALVLQVFASGKISLLGLVLRPSTALLMEVGVRHMLVMDVGM